MKILPWIDEPVLLVLNQARYPCLIRADHDLRCHHRFDNGQSEHIPGRRVNDKPGLALYRSRDLLGLTSKRDDFPAPNIRVGLRQIRRHRLMKILKWMVPAGPQNGWCVLSQLTAGFA